MKLTFRWYGENDPVTLEKIAQIPTMTGIVSAVYGVQPGEVWGEDQINAIRDAANRKGLAFEVVESVPVPEEIKLGTASAPRLIENYCENLRRLGKAGVKCVCYNFMPVFDWLRSDLARQNADGSTSLAYEHETVLKMDPAKGDLSLPGWDASYRPEELKGLLARYEALGEEGLWKNLAAFLEAVIPAAKTAGICMAIHPDDPPWGMFGLPRVITCRENLRRFLSLVPERENGLTFCTGSLGANPENDLPAMATEFCDRIHFAHLRNIRYLDKPLSFQEVGHPSACGSLDLFAIAKNLSDGGFTGYVRPDHGRAIWGEENSHPGYGLFDRALGATYLAGLFEAIEKTL